MNLINAVNRILQQTGILAGDDDELDDFSNTRFTNVAQKAKIAIQDELAELFSDKVFPYEQTQAFITLVESQRTYSLDSNFRRFIDRSPFLLEVDAATSTGVSQNVRLWEWPGGEENLRAVVLDYRDTEGPPGWFYRVGGTSYQIGVYPVPDAASAGEIYRYDFERSRTVTNASDTIPLISVEGVNALIESSARRFQYMRLEPAEQKALFPNGLSADPQVQQARSRVLEFARIKHAKEGYGRKYG